MDEERSIVERAVDTVLDAADEYGDLLRLAPAGKYLVAAYRWARNRRLATFLRALDAGTKRLSAQEQARFADYLESSAGRELLADYVESVMRSRSKVVTASFAVLYSDPDHFRFTADFKAKAVHALDGLSDRMVEAFLAICSERPNLVPIPDTPYPLYALRNRVLDMSPTLAAWSSEGLEWMSACSELIQRGLLSPDPSAGMRLADENQLWCVYIGASQDSERFDELLRIARAYVDATSEPA